MNIGPAICAIVAAASLWGSHAACAQAPTLAMVGPATTVSEGELKNLLVWNSPWEGRASTPGRMYSYRTIFHVRRDAVIAEVISYATNQRSDSVVSIRDGRLTWQDANGADITVALASGGDLVGTATLQNSDLPIVLKPRP